jgi:hypothetical protein
MGTQNGFTILNPQGQIIGGTSYPSTIPITDNGILQLKDGTMIVWANRLIVGNLYTGIMLYKFKHDGSYAE